VLSIVKMADDDIESKIARLRVELADAICMCSPDLSDCSPIERFIIKYSSLFMRGRPGVPREEDVKVMARYLHIQYTFQFQKESDLFQRQQESKDKKDYALMYSPDPPPEFNPKDPYGYYRD
jgi:hypothetical protein